MVKKILKLYNPWFKYKREVRRFARGNIFPGFYTTAFYVNKEITIGCHHIKICLCLRLLIIVRYWMCSVLARVSVVNRFYTIFNLPS